MNQEKNNSVDWGSLVMGILFTLTALLSFQNPASSLLSIVMVFGMFAIFKGLFEIFLRNRVKQLTGYKGYAPLVLGAIDIIFGVYLLCNLTVGLAILPFVFATWFILNSVFNLFTLDLAKLVSVGYYWFSMIVNILGIVVGVMLLMDPISSALTLSFLIGFYFMLFGIANIVYAFRR